MCSFGPTCSVAIFRLVSTTTLIKTCCVYFHALILQLLPVEEIVRPNRPLACLARLVRGRPGKVDTESSTKELGIVHIVDSRLCILGIQKLDKAEPLVLATLIVNWYLRGFDVTKGAERSF